MRARIPGLILAGGPAGSPAQTNYVKPRMNPLKRILLALFLFTLAALGLAGCSQTPQTVEVTRVVNQEVPIEVTRVVVETVPVEVTVLAPVEVTRLVEVVVTPTPEAVSLASPPAAPTATASPTQTPTPTATTDPLAVYSLYTVQPGDSLSSIAARTGVPVAEIMAANGLTAASVIIVGQQLIIPGWTGGAPPNGTVVPPPAGSPAPTAQPTVSGSANLLPNPSFEGDWYFFNGVQEWQISVGWFLNIDEGPNTLDPGDGGNFIRPEVRVVSTANLPPQEHNLFIFDGVKTVKVFKGGAPVHFELFTDVALQPGSYRFTLNFFPDVVSVYDALGQKVWASDSLAAEVRILYSGGGSDWLSATPGIRNTLNYDFTLTQPTTVRLGGAFRNRFVNVNNGWFLDNWILQKID